MGVLPTHRCYPALRRRREWHEVRKDLVMSTILLSYDTRSAVSSVVRQFQVTCSVKAKFHYAVQLASRSLADCRAAHKLVADRFEASLWIFGDFFASCVFSEPRAAGFRPAS